MSFIKKINFTSNTTIYAWKITEDFNYLLSHVVLKPSSLERVSKMKSESHQKGFLAVRMLLQHCGYTDYDLSYDHSGKPSLADGNKISITHSFEYSVIAISQQEIGIDIELCRDKIIRIGNKFAQEQFVQNYAEDEQKRILTVIWGAKESIFKIMNEPGISFLDHIAVHPFLLSDNNTTAQLNFNHEISNFTIYYKEIDNYTLVYAEKK